MSKNAGIGAIKAINRDNVKSRREKRKYKQWGKKSFPLFLFCTGMVCDKKIFPTKDSWVTLAREPLIPDSKELEKVFKLCNICLLNLPPPEKKASQRNKSGNNGTII